MTLPGRGFWAGLMIGFLSAGAAGLYAVNLQARVGYLDQTLNGANRLDNLNGLRVRLETGETEAANRFHRAVAWASVREAHYYECMGNSAWVLHSKADSTCMTELQESTRIPEEFEIPALEQAREDFARQRSAQPSETSR